MAQDHSGFLWKRSKSLLAGWQKRWFYLSGVYLYYYRSGDTKPKRNFCLARLGSIHVTAATAKVRRSTSPINLPRRMRATDRDSGSVASTPLLGSPRDSVDFPSDSDAMSVASEALSEMGSELDADLSLDTRRSFRLSISSLEKQNQCLSPDSVKLGAVSPTLSSHLTPPLRMASSSSCPGNLQDLADVPPPARSLRATSPLLMPPGGRRPRKLHRQRKSLPSAVMPERYGEDRHQFRIQMFDKNGVERPPLLLAHEKFDQVQAWVQAIQRNHKACSCPGLPGRPSRACVPRPVPPEFVSMDDLPQIARSGDILLFRAKNLVSAVVRGATQSDFDHVALVLKRVNGEVFLLESLLTGVWTNSWAEFHEKRASGYARIVLRQLKHVITRPNLTKLASFCQSVKGASYSVAPTKFVTRRSNSVLDFNDLKRTFFCSELVASAYKHIGLLRTGVSSTQYMPGTFASPDLLLQGNELGMCVEVTWPPHSETSSPR